MLKVYISIFFPMIAIIIALIAINYKLDTQYKTLCENKGGTAIYTSSTGWVCMSGSKIKVE